MNRKQFTLLIGLMVVLGVAGLAVYKKQNAARSAGNAALGQKLLGTFPVNDVTHIAIKQGTNELNLVKKDDLWRVRERSDYPANYNEISDFLLKARDLKVVQTEQVGPSQLPRLALVPGQGTNAALVVDFKDQGDKTIKSLLLGKKHLRKSNRPSPMGDDMGMGEGGFPDGRYVKVGVDAAEVAVISDPLANVEPKPDQWLSKDFFKVEKVRSVAVTFPDAATNSWKLSRESETGEWKLAEAKPGEQLDAAKASAVPNPLSSPTFTDVDTASKPEQLGLDKPTVVALETFDNFTYTLKVGQKANDNYPLALTVAAQLPKERTPGKDEKAEDKAKLDKEFKDNQKKLEDKLAQEKSYEKWTYLVSSWTLEPLLKERGQLMVEKKEEPKKDDKAAADVPAILGGVPADGVR
ncbi:MAG TPA: DUF4340 domain-containing protein [Candidatus Sulfotelmatobacter sp.]|nr:DUF4340 domain-containing protein [Candidatus Sulfotelmatobacter sp.]